MNVILKNCIESLKMDVKILNQIEYKQIGELIEQYFIFGNSGINWSLYPNKISITDNNDILKKINRTECFLLWDEGKLPILRTDLKLILNNLDCVTKVAFDTFVVDVKFGWIIEFHHSGVINLLIKDV